MWPLNSTEDRSISRNWLPYRYGEGDEESVLVTRLRNECGQSGGYLHLEEYVSLLSPLITLWKRMRGQGLFLSCPNKGPLLSHSARRSFPSQSHMPAERTPGSIRGGKQELRGQTLVLELEKEGRTAVCTYIFPSYSYTCTPFSPLCLVQSDWATLSISSGSPRYWPHKPLRFPTACKVRDLS